MKRLALILMAGFVALLLWLLAPILIYGWLVPLIGPVLPRPDGVPRDAAASYEWKASGMQWTWRRTLPHGCADWFATDSYAQVELTEAKGCGVTGKSVSYRSFGEPVTFDAYVPEAPYRTPCPFSKTPADMQVYRRLVAEAGAKATTHAERLMLRYVDARLAAFDGRALEPAQFGGCDDLKIEERSRPPQHVDPWEAAHGIGPPRGRD